MSSYVISKNAAGWRRIRKGNLMKYGSYVDQHETAASSSKWREKGAKTVIYRRAAPITAPKTPVRIPNHKFWPATNAGTAALDPEAAAALADLLAEPEAAADLLALVGLALAVVAAWVAAVEAAAADPPKGAVDCPSISD